MTSQALVVDVVAEAVASSHFVFAGFFITGGFTFTGTDVVTDVTALSQRPWTSAADAVSGRDDVTNDGSRLPYVSTDDIDEGGSLDDDDNTVSGWTSVTLGREADSFRWRHNRNSVSASRQLCTNGRDSVCLNLTSVEWWFLFIESDFSWLKTSRNMATHKTTTEHGARHGNKTK